MENYTEVSLIEIMFNHGYKLFDKKIYFDFIDYKFIDSGYSFIQVRTLFDKVHMLGSYDSRTDETLLIKVGLLSEIISINDKENAC